MSVTDAQIADWLERNYQPAKLGNIAFKDAPMVNWLPHDESAGGDFLQLRWKYGNPQAHGVTRAQAVARGAATGLKPAKVVLDYHTYYSHLPIDNTAIERARGGGLAATDVFQEGINGVMESHGDMLETFIWSDGYPTLGAIGGISGSTFTVAKEDIEKWEVDLEIVLAASRTTGALESGGASLTVTKVDRATRTITCNAGIVATIAAATNGDFAFVKSTRIDSAARQCAVGIKGYIPDSVGGSDAFGDTSLNRSIEPFRLAGARETINAGISVRQGLIDGLVVFKKYKVKPDALWMSVERWGELIKEMGTSVEYVNVKNEKYGLAVKGVVLYGPDGEIPCMASPKCPNANVYGLKRDSWRIYSVNGALIRSPFRYSKYLDSQTEDGILMAFRSFYQVGCKRPWENGVIIYS
jgi:hypothetical protein